MDGGEVVLANSIYAMNGSERIHGLNIVHDPPIYILSSIQTTSIYLYYSSTTKCESRYCARLNGGDDICCSVPVHSRMAGTHCV